jgi:hypothetical protein
MRSAPRRAVSRTGRSHALGQAVGSSLRSPPSRGGRGPRGLPVRTHEGSWRFAVWRRDAAEAASSRRRKGAPVPCGAERLFLLSNPLARRPPEGRLCRLRIGVRRPLPEGEGSASASGPATSRRTRLSPSARTAVPAPEGAAGLPVGGAAVRSRHTSCEAPCVRPQRPSHTSGTKPAWRVGPPVASGFGSARGPDPSGAPGAGTMPAALASAQGQARSFRMAAASSAALPSPLASSSALLAEGLVGRIVRRPWLGRLFGSFRSRIVSGHVAKLSSFASRSKRKMAIRACG